MLFTLFIKITIKFNIYHVYIHQFYFLKIKTIILKLNLISKKSNHFKLRKKFSFYFFYKI